MLLTSDQTINNSDITDSGAAQPAAPFNLIHSAAEKTQSAADQTKAFVAQKYAEIAEQSRDENANSCCGVGGCCTVDYAVFAEDYSKLDGYMAEADLGLGCGVPTEFAQIKTNDTVVDLGSGAGNDAFVSRAIVGEGGRVIGIDMTQAMIEKARVNTDRLGFTNVEFRRGDIEDIPMASNRADVVISNCVLNLVPNKSAAFSEMYRIIKPGGHFSISDVVLRGELPEPLRKDAEMYAGCVSGAIELDEYVRSLSEAGFVNITIQKMRQIVLPDEILRNYLNVDEIRELQEENRGILSVTVYGEKPEDEKCCKPGAGCC